MVLSKKGGFTPLETIERPEKRKMSLTGFTLIELMVVIAIIVVLAAVVAPQVFRQIEKARVASVVAFYNSVKVAANSYFVDTNSYPTAPGGGCNNDGSGGWSNCNTVNPGFVNGTSGSAGWDGPYLDRWPANPWGSTYRYENIYFTRFNSTTANEIYIFTPLPSQAAQRIDQIIDGTISSNTGKVREENNPASWSSGTPWVLMLISRDGPVD